MAGKIKARSVPFRARSVSDEELALSIPVANAPGSEAIESSR